MRLLFGSKLNLYSCEAGTGSPLIRLIRAMKGIEASKTLELV